MNDVNRYAFIEGQARHAPEAMSYPFYCYVCNRSFVDQNYHFCTPKSTKIIEGCSGVERGFEGATATFGRNADTHPLLSRGYRR